MPVALPDRLAVQQAQGACLPIHAWGTPGSREVALALNLLLARVLRSMSKPRPRPVIRTDDDVDDNLDPEADVDTDERVVQDG
jgi:hypothetical protein